MVEVIAVFAVLACVLLTGASRPLLLSWHVSPPLLGCLAAGGFGLSLVLVPTHGALLAIGIAAAAATGWLARRRRDRAQARITSAAVQTLCAELADDLRMGLVPEAALTSAAQRWPPLRAVSLAAHLHDDVAATLRVVAQRPGADGLRDVAAAWQVSQRSGSGLADALHQVARLLAARERRARQVDGELAAARATAMVVTGLPVLVLGMGSGLGTDPWAFFFSGAGVIVLGAAALLLFAGWLWLDRLTSRAMSR